MIFLWMNSQSDGSSRWKELLYKSRVHFLVLDQGQFYKDATNSVHI